MDPITAFSTAGTVATFILMGYHLVVNTYTIYNSASGMPKEDEHIGFVIGKLEKLAESMISTTPTLDLTEAEQGMQSVTLKCICVSNKLLEILNQSKTRDPRSVRQSAVAAFQSVLNKNKKEELKKELDECQKLFHMQLTNMISSDAVQGLKKLDKLLGRSNHISSEIAALRRHIIELEKGVTLSDIGENAANKLANLLQLSGNALTSIRSHQILQSLAFSKLHQRYETVGKAMSDTFEWIFEDDPDRSQRALRGKILFTNWLSSGEGVFHIAGKPGSGKSTLMKFIYRHEKSKHMLEGWAAGRKLVIGKHFFWRPGEDSLENSRAGLLKTLLHDALSQCIDLVPHVFPNQLAAVKDLPLQAPADLQFDGDDLNDAFNRLIESRNIFKDRCFFFMIDGLDEFQETLDEGYKQLIKLILSWTTKAPAAIKLCVSSREHAVFLDHFSEIQGLRLQDLTADDIHRYVKEKLESNPNFLDMEKPDDGANQLISQVSEKADGVFLWVALVVKLLDDACDEEDSFEDLERKIKFLPPEIRDLFDNLFNSIHESDRDQSAQTFAVVLKLASFKSGIRLSLLRYSLLDNFNADPLFASRSNFLDQEFLDLDDEPSKKRLKRARKQLYKRCRGLLEVTESDDEPLVNDTSPYTSLKGKPLSQRISLIHRSIQEYLEEEIISKERRNRTTGFDVIGAICQTYVAELVGLGSKQPDYDDTCSYPELLDILDMLSKLESDTVENRWIAAFQNLDKAKSRYLDNGTSELNFTHVYDRISPSMPYIGNRFSVAHSLALYGILNFFTAWDNSSACPLERDIRNGSLALVVIYALGNSFIETDKIKLTYVLRWLLSHGCSPNQATLEDDGGSVWGAFLYTLVLKNISTPPIRHPPLSQATQIMLEFGANPDFSFFISTSPEGSADIETVQIVPPAPVGTSTVTSVYNFIDDSLENTELVKIVSSKGGRATLREVIEVLNPPNVESLLSLIDRNMHSQQLVQDGLASETAYAPSLPSSEQTAKRKHEEDTKIISSPRRKSTRRAVGACSDSTEVIVHAEPEIHNPVVLDGQGNKAAYAPSMSNPEEEIKIEASTDEKDKEENEAGAAVDSTAGDQSTEVTMRAHAGTKLMQVVKNPLVSFILGKRLLVQDYA
ncbi:hypothetical protein F4804DRAFT_178965 [Jackrogersella minutella]|nr:hypothetical protein F4804DRAFT_178965 [Jackrogersella minutella]